MPRAVVTNTTTPDRHPCLTTWGRRTAGGARLFPRDAGRAGRITVAVEETWGLLGGPYLKPEDRGRLCPILCPLPPLFASRRKTSDL